MATIPPTPSPSLAPVFNHMMNFLSWQKGHHQMRKREARREGAWLICWVPVSQEISSAALCNRTTNTKLWRPGRADPSAHQCGYREDLLLFASWPHIPHYFPCCLSEPWASQFSLLTKKKNSLFISYLTSKLNWLTQEQTSTSNGSREGVRQPCWQSGLLGDNEFLDKLSSS